MGILQKTQKMLLPYFKQNQRILAISTRGYFQLFHVFYTKEKTEFISTDLILKSADLNDICITECGRIFARPTGQIKIVEIRQREDEKKKWFIQLFTSSSLKQVKHETPPSQCKNFFQKITGLAKVMVSYPAVDQCQYTYDETKGVLYQLLTYYKKITGKTEEARQAVIVYELFDNVECFTRRAKIQLGNLKQKINDFMFSNFHFYYGMESMAIQRISAIKKTESDLQDLKVFFYDGTQANLCFKRKLSDNDLLKVLKFGRDLFTSEVMVVDVFPKGESKSNMISRSCINARSFNNQNATKFTNQQPSNLHYIIQKSINGMSYIAADKADNYSLQSKGLSLSAIRECRDSFKIYPMQQLDEKGPLDIFEKVDNEIQTSHKLFPPDSQNLWNKEQSFILKQDKFHRTKQLKFMTANSISHQVFFGPTEFYVLYDQSIQLLLSLRPVDHLFTVLKYIELTSFRNKPTKEMLYDFAEANTFASQIEICTSLIQILCQKNTNFYVSIPILLQLFEKNPDEFPNVVLFLKSHNFPVLDCTDLNRRFVDNLNPVSKPGENTMIMMKNDSTTMAHIVLSLLDLFRFETSDEAELCIFEESVVFYFTKLISPIYNSQLYTKNPTTSLKIGTVFENNELQMIQVRLKQLVKFLQSCPEITIDMQSESRLTKFMYQFLQTVERAEQLVSLVLLISDNTTLFEIFEDTENYRIVFLTFKELLEGDFHIDEFCGQLLCEHCMLLNEEEATNFRIYNNFAVFFNSDMVDYVYFVKQINEKIQKNNKIGSKTGFKDVSNPYISNDSTNASIESSRLFVSRKTLTLKTEIVPSFLQIDFTEEINGFLTIAKNLNLLNIEMLLPLFIHTKNLSSFFEILSVKLMNLKQEKRLAKDDDKPAISQKIHECRIVIFAILTDLQYRYNNYSRFAKFIEKTKEFLCEMKLISKGIQKHIESFLLSHFKQQSVKKAKGLTLYQVSFYSRTEIELNFDECLDISLKIPDRKLNLLLFSSMMEENVMRKCRMLSSFNVQTLLKNFDQVFISLKAAKFFSHLMVESENQEKLAFEIYVKLANFKTKQNEFLSIDEQLSYLIKSLEVIKTTKEPHIKEKAKEIETSILTLRVFRISSKEYAQKLKASSQIIAYDSEYDQQFIREFENQLSEIKHDENLVMDSLEERRLFFSIFMMFYLKKNNDDERFTINFRRAIASFSDGESPQYPENFISMFDELLLIEDTFSQNQASIILAEVMKANAKNNTFLFIFENFMDYKELIMGNMNEPTKAKWQKKCPNYQNKHIHWVNEWLLLRKIINSQDLIRAYSELTRKTVWIKMNEMEVFFLGYSCSFFIFERIQKLQKYMNFCEAEKRDEFDDKAFANSFSSNMEIITDIMSDLKTILSYLFVLKHNNAAYESLNNMYLELNDRVQEFINQKNTENEYD